MPSSNRELTPPEKKALEKGFESKDPSK